MGQFYGLVQAKERGARFQHVLLIGVSLYQTTRFCSARRGRVKRVRESLENSLLARIELIESYAKVSFSERKCPFRCSSLISNNHLQFVLQISSMIEIEVEMDSNVLAAEAVSNAVTIYLHLST